MIIFVCEERKKRKMSRGNLVRVSGSKNKRIKASGRSRTRNTSGVQKEAGSRGATKGYKRNEVTRIFKKWEN